mgnify:CR=1 FL=1
MAYRYDKQEDGNYTVRSVAIFAKCKRGESEFDETWMDKAVAIANAEQTMGYQPPVFVKHNGEYSPTNTDDETTDGRLASLRRAKVRVRGQLEEGIVADLIDVPQESLDKIIQHRLPGRSIESVQPMTRNKIDGLALLGRTPPYHSLAQGSEPHFEIFSLDADASGSSKTVVHFMEMEMEDAAPESSAQNPEAPKAEELLRAIADILKSYAPQQDDEMAPEPDMVDRSAETRGMAHMQLEETRPESSEASEDTMSEPKNDVGTEIELLQAKFDLLVQQNDLLKAQLALKSTEASEKGEEAARAEAESQVTALFKELREENLVFSEDYVREQVTKFGLDTFRSSFKPLMLPAPITPAGGLPANISAPSREASEKFSAFEADTDLKAFSALNPALKQVAMGAAVEYDSEVAKWAGFAENNPRDFFISQEVKRAQTPA